ncbi:MAG: DUF2207 domain-containing protein [Marmoricola sp.]
MKKIAGWILGVIVLIGAIAFGAVNTDGSGDGSSETSTITSYYADFDVAANGDLRATEKLTVNFPDFKHGIFRFFDTQDPNYDRNRLIPTDIKVTMDGSSVPFDVQKEGHGRYRNVKIGDAGRTITGSHLYTITYKIKGVLTKGTNGSRTQFYWNLIPQGWRQDISQSKLTVHLPAPSEHLQCAVGTGSSQTACTATGHGTKTLVVTTGPISDHTPVTVKTGLDIKTPAADTRPWSSRVDAIMGQHPAVVVIVLILAGLAALGGTALSLSTREKPPGLPLMYAPPEGIGPAQGAYILNEKIDNKAFVATMMYAAENNAVELTQSDKSWTVTGGADTAAWEKIDNVTVLTLNSLGIKSVGASFTAAPGSVSAGKKLKSALDSFHANTSGWAKISGLMVRSGLGGGGFIMLLAVWALVIYLGAINPLNASIVALIPGAFAITALSVSFSGAGTKRTAAGRELWSRVGGFHRILSTDSAVERFDFSGRKELYTQYLPWAVAFDCADKWAAKYKLETAEDPPTPHYFAGYTGLYAGSMVNQMVDSFDSSVSSAISSYEATQSSSSSGGGGGFSGGGGGGGGGGGSW